MRSKINLVTFFIIITLTYFVLTSFNSKKNDCNRDELLQLAIPKLKNFTLIQDYLFSIKKKKKSDPIEYSKQTITLNRGITYKFYAVRNDQFDGVPIVYIYNNAKQEFLLGSTFNVTMKKFYDEITFECKTTGNYCLSFCFQDGLEGCGLGIFSSNVKE